MPDKIPASFGPFGPGDKMIRSGTESASIPAPAYRYTRLPLSFPTRFSYMLTAVSLTILTVFLKRRYILFIIIPPDFQMPKIPNIPVYFQNVRDDILVVPPGIHYGFGLYTSDREDFFSVRRAARMLLQHISICGPVHKKTSISRIRKILATYHIVSLLIQNFFDISPL